jgi:hypothetical protein
MPQSSLKTGEIGIGWMCLTCGNRVKTMTCEEAMTFSSTKICTCGHSINTILMDTCLKRIEDGLESFGQWHLQVNGIS